MNLRFKILSGFLVLSLMLATAGLISIYEFKQISRSVKVLLDENYKSITAAKDMLDGLDREDSGIFLLMSGDWENGRQAVQAANHHFQQSFAVVEDNITLDGEQAIVDAIEKSYANYKKLWERPIVDTPRQGNMEWYFSEVHPALLNVRKTINNLMTMNDKAMYNTASLLRERAGRAIMPGIVAIVSALIFTFIFNFFINLYVIQPLQRLTQAIKRHLNNGDPFSFQVESRDEIFKLAESIRELIGSGFHRNGRDG